MSTPPWGVLPENRIYQLVVREGDRPDRLDPDIEHKRGLTDWIWEIMEAAWQQEGKLRPNFSQIVDCWHNRAVGGDLISSRHISMSNSMAGQIYSVPGERCGY
jgi:hypothetical protein